MKQEINEINSVCDRGLNKTSSLITGIEQLPLTYVFCVLNKYHIKNISNMERKKYEPT